MKSITAGFRRACGVSANGEAHCWGANFYGGLGDGSTTNSTTPVPVSGGLNFTSISVGAGHSCGIATGDEAYCWGRNVEGQLGTGSTTSESAPVAVSGALAFTSISVGSFHTCGVTTTGAAYCWGSTNFGQLGLGHLPGTHVETPMPVLGGLSFVAVSSRRQTYVRHHDRQCGVLLGAGSLRQVGTRLHEYCSVSRTSVWRLLILICERWR